MSSVNTGGGAGKYEAAPLSEQQMNELGDQLDLIFPDRNSFKKFIRILLEKKIPIGEPISEAEMEKLAHEMADEFPESLLNKKGMTKKELKKQIKSLLQAAGKKGLSEEQLDQIASQLAELYPGIRADKQPAADQIVSGKQLEGKEQKDLYKTAADDPHLEKPHKNDAARFGEGINDADKTTNQLQANPWFKPTPLQTILAVILEIVKCGKRTKNIERQIAFDYTIDQIETAKLQAQYIIDAAEQQAQMHEKMAEKYREKAIVAAVMGGLSVLGTIGFGAIGAKWNMGMQASQMGTQAIGSAKESINAFIDADMKMIEAKYTRSKSFFDAAKEFAAAYREIASKESDSAKQAARDADEAIRAALQFLDQAAKAQFQHTIKVQGSSAA